MIRPLRAIFQGGFSVQAETRLSNVRIIFFGGKGPGRPEHRVVHLFAFCCGRGFSGAATELWRQTGVTPSGRDAGVASSDQAQLLGDQFHVIRMVRFFVGSLRNSRAITRDSRLESSHSDRQPPPTRLVQGSLNEEIDS